MSSFWTRSLVLLALLSVSQALLYQCSSINYWKGKLIWEDSFQCSNMTVAVERCEQVELAYLGNMLEIEMDQNPNLNIGLPGLGNNWTMLMTASHEGHYKLVEKLLENGASDINMQDKCGWSALMFAAFTGLSNEVVELLLQHGADVNLVNNDSHTALFMASEKGHVEIIKLLLRNGTNIMHRDIWGISAVELGVFGQASCQPAVMEVFLQSCGDADCINILGNALWRAVESCCPVIAKAILCSGVPVYNLQELVVYSAEEHSRKSRCFKSMNTLMLKYETATIECTDPPNDAYETVTIECTDPPNDGNDNYNILMVVAIAVVISLLVAIALLLLVARRWRKLRRWKKLCQWRKPLRRSKDMDHVENKPLLFDADQEFYKQLVNEVATQTSKWILIAINLNIDSAKIDQISGNMEHCFREVFTIWRRERKRPFNWNTMVEVLDCDSVGEHFLARTLREKYLECDSLVMA